MTWTLANRHIGPGGHLARLLLLALLLLGMPAQAVETMSPRLQIGISLLPAVIAANQSMGTNPNIPLPVYLVYRDHRRVAEQLIPALAKIEVIRNHPLVVSSISLDQLLAAGPTPMSVVFLAEPMGARLDELIEFSRARRLLLFSPFKGDVERGAAAGFKVTDKVLPMVNMPYLRAASIQLKAFFLRIAVKYE